MSAAPGAITAAANAMPVAPESGFDPKTGELRIGDLVYRARKYSRRLRIENTALDDPELGANMLALRAKLTAGTEPATAEDLAGYSEANNKALDVTYGRLVLLFADADGNPPSLDAAMDELSDFDAQDAVEYATVNPTTRTPEATSS
jgi:hypothetical protein